MVLTKMKRHLSEHFKNDRGLGMIEILIGSVMALVLLAVTVILYTNNQSKLQDESDSTNIRAKGRFAIEQLAEEIRMAGFGLPPSQGLTAIAAGSLSFQSNLTDVRTTTPPCTACPGTVAGATGATTLTVVDENGFSSGDKIVISNPNFNQSELNTVTGTGTGSLSLGAGLASNYVYGVNTNLVTVNKYNDITIALSGTSVVKTVDGAATTLVSDVVATTGLSFNFYGVTTPSGVVRVGITLNLVDPDNSETSIEFKTDVDLRNS